MNEFTKGDRVLVWDNNESQCAEKNFVAMLEGQYICRSNAENAVLVGWRHAKPTPREPRVCYRKILGDKVLSCTVFEKEEIRPEGNYVKFIEVLEDD